MKMREAVVIWTPAWAEEPGAGNIRVERRGSGWQRTPGDRWMPATSLGAYGEMPTKGDRIKQLLGMHILFNTVVVRDGIDCKAAHKAFLHIEEYRKSISPDAPGAED